MPRTRSGKQEDNGTTGPMRTSRRSLAVRTQDAQVSLAKFAREAQEGNFETSLQEASDDLRRLSQESAVNKAQGAEVELKLRKTATRVLALTEQAQRSPEVIDAKVRAVMEEKGYGKHLETLNDEITKHKANTDRVCGNLNKAIEEFLRTYSANNASVVADQQQQLEESLKHASKDVKSDTRDNGLANALNSTVNKRIRGIFADRLTMMAGDLSESSKTLDTTRGLLQTMEGQPRQTRDRSSWMLRTFGMGADEGWVPPADEQRMGLNFNPRALAQQ